MTTEKHKSPAAPNHLVHYGYMIFLIAMTSTGCSYTGIEKHLVPSETMSGWTVDVQGDFLVLESICNSQPAIFTLRSQLSFDADIYYGLLIVPIGSADIMDEPLDKLRAYVGYKDKISDCRNIDVLLEHDGIATPPAEIDLVNDPMTYCKLTWEVSIQDAKEIAFLANNCAGSELKFNIRNDKRYVYDKIQG